MIGHRNFFLEVEGNQLDSLEEYASVAHVTFPSARGKRKSHVALNAPSDNPLCPEPIPIHHEVIWTVDLLQWWYWWVDLQLQPTSGATVYKERSMRCTGFWMQSYASGPSRLLYATPNHWLDQTTFQIKGFPPIPTTLLNSLGRGPSV